MRVGPRQMRVIPLTLPRCTLVKNMIPLSSVLRLEHAVQPNKIARDRLIMVPWLHDDSPYVVASGSTTAAPEERSSEPRSIHKVNTISGD